MTTPAQWSERRRQSQAALAKASGRHQAKLVDLVVDEVSLVSRPAHGIEGWLVRKSAGTPSADGHAHDPNFHYLDDQEQKSAALLHGSGDLKPGDRKPVQGAEERAAIGRDTCGCLYLLSPETVEKGTATKLALAKAAEPAPAQWGDSLTPAEVAYMTGETNELP
jgi:hypothetical protein